MNHRLLIPLFIAFPVLLSAQSCGFSEGKNLAELRAAVFAKNDPVRSQLHFSGITLPGQQERAATLHPFVLLPKWSAETLPFFCKIEHDWGKKSRLPFKFRLGSVEYVDWLEGK